MRTGYAKGSKHREPVAVICEREMPSTQRALGLRRCGHYLVPQSDCHSSSN